MSTSGRSGSTAAKKQRRSEAELRHDAEVLEAKYRFWMAVILGLFGLGAFGMLIPIASILVGQQTGIDVSVSITMTLTLAVTATGFALANRHSTKRARRAEIRVDTLTGKLEVEETATTAERSRADALQRDLEALRSDNDRLRADLAGVNLGRGL